MKQTDENTWIEMHKLIRNTRKKLINFTTTIHNEQKLDFFFNDKLKIKKNIKHIINICMLYRKL